MFEIEKRFKTKKTPKKIDRYDGTSFKFTTAPSITFLEILIYQIRVAIEFMKGFSLLRKYFLAATIFGSSKETLPSKYYEEAEKLAAGLAKRKFTVITGGGGGIMRSSNMGAFKAGGNSVGVNIDLSKDEPANNFLTDSRVFRYFFVRKTILSFASEIYIYMPGGYGTLDELFKILTLVKTRKISRTPIILLGKQFWTPLIDWLNDYLKTEYKTISENDIKFFVLCDSADEVLRYIDSLNISDCKESFYL